MKKKIALLFVIILSPVLTFNIFSQGNLLVTPVRVIFENGKQKEDLNLTNIGKDTAVYMVSFIDYKMLEDGSFKQLDKPDSVTNAVRYLRIFPRRVTLPPNQSQIIRMQFRKTPDMKDGEYRSHIYFRAEQEVNPLGMKDLKIDSTQMAVKITPIFGISIPVIIRTGNLKLQLSLSDVSLSAINDSTSNLKVTINRSGEKSAYGNIKVDYVPEKGSKIQVGITNGIGVYNELTKRKFSMLLHLSNEKRLNAGKLVISYLSSAETGNVELARAEYVIHK
jgi:P pilus assembly chaperone PapD